MSQREEINPGEWFFVSDRAILVETYESIIGNAKKFGTSKDQAVYVFSFKGKLNQQDKEDDVTIIMPLQSAWDLFNDVLNGFELLKKVNEE